MDDKFLSYIAAERAKIAKQRAKLDAAEDVLDKSEKHYLASGAVKTSESKNDASQNINNTKDGFVLALEGAQKILGAIRYPYPPSATIKDRVKVILSKHPEGLTSGQILRILNATGLPNLYRESLSPQLSRLKKHDEVLDSQNGVWLLKKNGGEDDLSDAL